LTEKRGKKWSEPEVEEKRGEREREERGS